MKKIEKSLPVRAKIKLPPDDPLWCLLHQGVPEKEGKNRQIGQQGTGEQNRVYPLEMEDSLPQNPPKQEEVQNGMALSVQLDLSDPTFSGLEKLVRRAKRTYRYSSSNN
jgi:hypothetical protein